MDSFRVRLAPLAAARAIEEYVINEGITTECVGRFASSSPDGKDAILMVFEKYFMRNSSRASLSIMVENLNGTTVVASVGSGGGQNTLFSFDWGAGDSFASLAREALENYIV